jgi:hypothetical protein
MGSGSSSTSIAHVLTDYKNARGFYINAQVDAKARPCIVFSSPGLASASAAFDWEAKTVTVDYTVAPFSRPTEADLAYRATLTLSLLDLASVIGEWALACSLKSLSLHEAREVFVAQLNDHVARGVTIALPAGDTEISEEHCQKVIRSNGRKVDVSYFGAQAAGTTTTTTTTSAPAALTSMTCLHGIAFAARCRFDEGTATAHWHSSSGLHAFRNSHHPRLFRRSCAACEKLAGVQCCCGLVWYCNKACQTRETHRIVAIVVFVSIAFCD